MFFVFFKESAEFYQYEEEHRGIYCVFVLQFNPPSQRDLP